MNKLKKKAKVIDLFCGVGGMTHGFVREGFDVVAGIDIDKTCEYSYVKNNPSVFLHRDIKDVTSQDLLDLYGGADVKILIGCAPCQPFSSLNLKRGVYKNHDSRWSALEKFIDLIDSVQPDIVSMENVKDLFDEKKFPIFGKFVEALKRNKYEVSYRVVDASYYGVPQKRKRLVLLASKFGKIELIPETHNKENLVTVRQVISHLSTIRDGQTSKKDPLHKASKLSDLNKKRIIATPKNGGGAKDWEESLVLECHKKDSGSSYKSSVYGRMRWDEPAPTMTTHCVNLGTGRFGHPTQNRAISLREAALFQSFPEDYIFGQADGVLMTVTAKHIGNAVPVRLGEVIAQSIKAHLSLYIK